MSIQVMNCKNVLNSIVAEGKSASPIEFSESSGFFENKKIICLGTCRLTVDDFLT